MKKYNRTIFTLIVICLFTIYSNQLIAQQSKVDSAIMLFNKSAGSNPLDTESFDAAWALLANSDLLTESQFEQIETMAFNYKHTKLYYTADDILGAAFDGMSKKDPERAITFGKQQVEKFDKLNSPQAANARRFFLYSMRLPFRNSNRLEEGFRYYTQKLNEYKTRKDSLCIVECYHVLGGFYGVSGLLDLAIYNLKKSNTYVDTLIDKGRYIGNIGFIGYHYLLKSNKKECLKFSRLSIKELRKTFASGVGFMGRPLYKVRCYWSWERSMCSRRLWLTQISGFI